MPVKFSNNAVTATTIAISVSDTTLSVPSGHGARFPALAAGDWCYLTLIDSGGNMEIVKATARAGDVFTIVRAQEGTTARAFNVGTVLSHRVTAQSIADLVAGFVTTAQLAAKADASALSNYATTTQLAAKADASALGGYAALGGCTFSGRVYSASLNASTDNGDYSSYQIKNNSGTGDGALAAMSFVCQGHYGIKLYLRADGFFGLGGWSSAAWRWYSASNGDMTASGNIIAYSDPRLKEEVTPLTDALDKLKRLNGVRFKWKDMPFLGHAGEYDYGVMADEVAAVAPELVGDTAIESDTGDKYKAVAYDKLVAFTIEAIKVLATRVEQLEAKR